MSYFSLIIYSPVNRDDFISKYRNSNFPREEVLKQVIG